MIRLRRATDFNSSIPQSLTPMLKDERPTSNIERPMSNNDVAPLLKLLLNRIKKQTPNEKQRFRVQGSKVLTSVSLSFPIQDSTFDVRCSMFIFFQSLNPSIPVSIFINISLPEFPLSEPCWWQPPSLYYRQQPTYLFHFESIHPP